MPRVGSRLTLPGVPLATRGAAMGPNYGERPGAPVRTSATSEKSKQSSSHLVGSGKGTRSALSALSRRISMARWNSLAMSAGSSGLAHRLPSFIVTWTTTSLG
jgi:hypothetical protein